MLTWSVLPCKYICQVYCMIVSTQGGSCGHQICHTWCIYAFHFRCTMSHRKHCKMSSEEEALNEELVHWNMLICCKWPFFSLINAYLNLLTVSFICCELFSDCFKKLSVTNMGKAFLCQKHFSCWERGNFIKKTEAVNIFVRKNICFWGNETRCAVLFL